MSFLAMLLTADELAARLGMHPVYVRDVVSLKKPRPEGRGEPAQGGDNPIFRWMASTFVLAAGLKERG